MLTEISTFGWFGDGYGVLSVATFGWYIDGAGGGIFIPRNDVFGDMFN